MRSLWDMTRFIRQENPPIIHTHGISDTLLAYTAIKLSIQSQRLRIITSFHGVFSHAPNRYWVAAQVLNLCSDVIIPVSKSGAEKLKRYGLSNQKNMQVVPNGVDLTRFDPTKNKPHPQLAALREKGIQLVGLVGRLSPEKGHTVFLDAAAKIVSVIPNVKFVIVGDGPMRPELERMATTLGLNEQVLFMGKRDADEIPTILTSLDVVALTSYVEAFPLTVLETMAMQKPIVATSVGDVPDIIQQDITGILVPSRDATAVSVGIVRLLRDPRFRESIGVKARQRIEQYYSIDEIVTQIEAQYRSLIEMEK
jgi:glycosyltransferase involved in cell wall biosynthesis